MGLDFKEKATEVAGSTLKNATSGDKLSNDNSEGASKLTQYGARTVVNTVDKTISHSAYKKAEQYASNNQEVANQVLLHDKAVDSGQMLHASDSSAKLITASRRRAKAEALREGKSLSYELTPDAKKLRDNRKKLQKKLQQEYKVKTEVKGGFKSNLRIEQTAESDLYSNKFKGADAIRNASSGALHFMDDMADGGDSNSTQNAWIDSSSKVLDTASRVYSLSQTAKYHRASKKEAEIAKLARQEDRIAMNNIKLEYKTALKDAKQGELWKSSNPYDRHLQKKAIKKKYMKNAIKEYQDAKKAGSTGKVVYDTGLSVVDKAKQLVKKAIEVIKALLSTAWGKIAIVVVLVVAIIIGLLSVFLPVLMLSFGGDSDFSSPPQMGRFPDEVLQWREWVVERCEANNDPNSNIDLTRFVPAILATIQQESGGISESWGGDLMQCKESGYWVDDNMPDDWTTEQRSIDAGIRYFYDMLKNWGCTEPDDLVRLQIVAQGYNYGPGWFDWLRECQIEEWSLEVSSAYSDQMAEQMGWTSYGHKPYGEEWLKKYEAGGLAGSGAIVVEVGPGGVMKTAQNQIGIMEEPAGTNKVIFNTEYYGQEVAGDDYPWCCVFVWWCFYKSGNGDAFYNGEKTAGCGAVYSWAQSDGLFINGSEAKYGDLVLFGNNEHIEFVVCKNDDGSYTTIGGNTSPEESGSQSNGGCVAMRTRYTTGDFPITSFIRPEYQGE